MPRTNTLIEITVPAAEPVTYRDALIAFESDESVFAPTMALPKRVAATAVGVGVAGAIGVGVGVAVPTGVCVGVDVATDVGESVAVSVVVGLAVGVASAGVTVGVGDDVAVGVDVGVGAPPDPYVAKIENCSVPCEDGPKLPGNVPNGAEF